VCNSFVLIKRHFFNFRLTFLKEQVDQAKKINQVNFLKTPYWKNYHVWHNIGKFLDLLGHFGDKDMIDFKKYPFLLNHSIMFYLPAPIV